jgi:hypothetical protein
MATRSGRPPRSSRCPARWWRPRITAQRRPVAHWPASGWRAGAGEFADRVRIIGLVRPLEIYLRGRRPQTERRPGDRELKLIAWDAEFHLSIVLPAKPTAKMSLQRPGHCAVHDEVITQPARFRIRVRNRDSATRRARRLVVQSDGGELGFALRSVRNRQAVPAPHQLPWHHGCFSWRTVQICAPAA